LAVPTDHYATLGIDPSAEYETIRQAWVAAARAHHPDVLGEVSEDERRSAERQMHAINEAWRILGSEELKSTYDKERGRNKEESASVEETWSDDWFDLDAVDPPGFEVGNPLVATVLRVLPWLVVGAIGVGIFVLSAFATNSRPERWDNPNPRTLPEECVLIGENGRVEGDANCDDDATRRVERGPIPEDSPGQRCPPGKEKVTTRNELEFYCLFPSKQAGNS
jgi:hypothetical protein